MNPLHQSSPEPRRPSSVAGPEPWHSPWSIDEDLPTSRMWSEREPSLESRPLPTQIDSVPQVRAAIAQPAVTPKAAPVPVPLPRPIEGPVVTEQSKPSPHPSSPAPQTIPASGIGSLVAPPLPLDQKHLAIKQMLAHQQRRRMQRLVAIASSVFVFMLLAWYYTADDPLPTDHDLLPPREVPTGGVPRAPDLLKLALESTVTTDAKNFTGQPTWAWDTPLLSLAVSTNAVALDNLRDLLGQSEWSPTHAAWMLEDLGSHSKWKDLGLAKAAATFYFARLNDDESAMQSALEIATLARKMQTVSAWPTFYARAVEWHQLACECMSELLRTTHLSARKLALFQAEFESVAPSDALLREDLSHFYDFERQFVLSATSRDAVATRVPKGTRLPRLFFKPHQTLALFTKAFRSLREEVTKPPYARVDPVTALIGPLGAARASALSSNRAGIAHANQRIWPYALLVDRQGLQSSRHLIVLTSFAIRRYAMDHSALPQTLSDLVPNYFSDLPKDPFNGEPLHYDSQRGLLYSVGQDYLDSGGHVGALPLSDAYEPTARVK